MIPPALPARRRLRRQQGLTIVEIAVALGVLAILFTGIFSALTTANLASLSAREAQAASEEALFRMDQMASQPFSFLSTTAQPLYHHVRYKTGGFDANGNPNTATLRAAPAANFNYLIARGVAGPPAGDSATDPKACYVHMEMVPGSNNRVVEIQVLVCWQSTDGSIRRVDLVSRVTE